jgi:PAS domain S-box-containing protein
MADAPGWESEGRLRAAVDSAPSGLLMVDREGRMVLVNREIERIFGYPREELLGQSIELLVPQRLRGGHQGVRAGFAVDPKVRAMGAGRELLGRRKDGSEVPVEIGLTPVATADGLFTLSSIVDISARRNAERELRLLEEQLRQAQKMEAVGTLAAGIAHDFNNLLGAIVGLAEMLRPALKGQPEALDDLAEILDATQHGRQLVERILTFSRRKTPERHPLDLVHTVRSAQSLLRAAIPATVSVNLTLPDTPQSVSADETAVFQVLMNLAMNAAHAMPGGGTLRIGVAPIFVRDSVARANPDLREGPYSLLSVQDTGTGIDPAHRARIFEPFFTTRAPGSGSGLGLAVVRAIMHDHQGAIVLESELGRGTTMRCFFPTLATDAPSGAVESAAAPHGAGERILYVDDQASLARLGERCLLALDYRVTPETDPIRALGRFRSDPGTFDLVVTDFTMPGMTGLDLATALTGIRADIPVIMLTGFVEEFDPERMRAAGVRTVLRKPVGLDELGQAVRDALGS